MLPALAAFFLVAAAGFTQAQETSRRAPDETPSRVLGMKDFILRGAPACEVRFVYAGMPEENLFWEEPCADVTAMMMTQSNLEELLKWDRLDSFAQDFINAMPGGQVLYVGGSFTASIYPVNTTGLSYEITVAD